jgi:hypothetical protein
MKTPIAAFTCALALVASGCTADNIQTVSMEALCAPPDDAAKCAGSAGKCDMLLASARPWLSTQSLGHANGFEMFTQVLNQAPNNADESTGRVNANDAIITGYELDFASAYYNRAAFFYPANFYVPAAGVFAPVIKYIPEEISAEMQMAFPLYNGADITTGPIPVTVGVRLRGHLLDDREFTTGTFTVTIDVYNEDAGVPACPTAGDVFVACPNYGQTASTDCVTP